MTELVLSEFIVQHFVVRSLVQTPHIQFQSPDYQGALIKEKQHFKSICMYLLLVQYKISFNITSKKQILVTILNKSSMWK